MSHFRTSQCLNGYWNFLPILHETGLKHNPPGAIPQTGWLNEAILVPCSWNQGNGDEWAMKATEEKPPWYDWRVYSSTNCPIEWHQTNSAWYSRAFSVDGVNTPGV